MQLKILRSYFVLFDSTEPSEPDSTVKLRRLLEVESALVKEYAGNIRSEINAMAG